VRRRYAAMFLVIIWSFVVRYFVRPSLYVLALVSDRVRDQLQGRPRAKNLAVDLATIRRKFDDCVVFFCSSAGEYEQAKPIIDRLAAQPHVLCHVVFFSVSGIKFLRARKDKVSCTLSPMDDVFEWGTIYAALRPSVTVVVRHELWPAFLWIASEWSRVVVINAVVPAFLGRQSQLRESINLLAKAWLLRFVDLVCVVSKKDQDFFLGRLGLFSNKIQITGDTKYDRVLERAAASEKHADKLRDIFRKTWRPTGTEITLIAGSIHLPDVDVLLDALNDSMMSQIKVIMVPHDVSSANVAKIFDKIKTHGQTVELFSEIKIAEFKFPDLHPRFIIVDELGYLFDLYAVADFAWVGGAIHDKVHNVLEPCAWGVPVSCGPRMDNSQEAVALRSDNLLICSDDPSEVREGWRRILQSIQSHGSNVRRFAQAMGGASERVVKATFQVQHGIIKRD
jgi:3-deoxy-D-manno-octulosonic-acid transferase